MSYGVHAYAVDLASLKKTLGSGDSVFAKRLSKKFAKELAEVDDLGFDEGGPSAADCLRTLIVGGVDAAHAAADDEDVPGYLFGYALEIVCREIGDRLPNRAFSGMGSEYFEAIDAALKKAKSTRTISSIVNRGDPMKLPFIDDFPSIGWLSAAEAAEWSADLASLLGALSSSKGAEHATGGEITLAKDGEVWAGRVDGTTVVETFGAAGKKQETAKTKLATASGAQKRLAKLAGALRGQGWKELAPAPEGFSGRVKGTQLIVVSGGKKKITKFPTKAAAQSALIAALTASNAGGGAEASADGMDPDARKGLRELQGWVDTAVAKKRGLITFYY